MVESSIVLYGDEIVAVDIGGPVSVEFDFDKIWNFFKQKKASGTWSSRFLKYYHVHPEGLLDYSLTDLNCVKGLSLALGSCFNFNIITFNNSNINDLSYNRVCFDYAPKFFKGITVNEDHSWNSLSKEHLLLLKTLSYGHVNLGQ